MARTKNLLAGCLFTTGVMGGMAAGTWENSSEDAVKSLTAAMTAQQLDAIAAADAVNPNRFVAALLIPDSQLLVVEAEYANPAELQALIARHQYREVYTALQQPATEASRMMFLDTGCDGLKVDRDAVDVLYEHGANEVLLNGDWKKAKLSEAAYQQKAQQAIAEFTRAVTLLRSTVGGTAAPVPAAQSSRVPHRLEAK